MLNHTSLADVVALAFDSPEDEARHIAETIKSLHGVAFDDGNGERGLSWSDMAVLLRSVRANGTVITEVLRDAEIPFVVTGLANLFATDEASAARDLFHYISGETIKDEKPPTDKALRQSWETANLGLAKRKLGEGLRYAKQVRDILHGNSGENPPSIQAVFLTFLEMAELREEKVPGSRGQVVLFNLGQFSKVITDWETINFSSKPAETFQGFAEFLHYQADSAYSEGAEDGDYVVPDAVQINDRPPGERTASGRQYFCRY